MAAQLVESLDGCIVPQELSSCVQRQAPKDLESRKGQLLWMPQVTYLPNIPVESAGFGYTRPLGQVTNSQVLCDLMNSETLALERNLTEKVHL